MVTKIWFLLLLFYIRILKLFVSFHNHVQKNRAQPVKTRRNALEFLLHHYSHLYNGVKYISNLRVVLEIKILYITHLANAQQMLLAFFQPQPLILLPMLPWFCVILKSNNINAHLDYWEFLYLLRDSTNTSFKRKKAYCLLCSWILDTKSSEYCITI